VIRARLEELRRERDQASAERDTRRPARGLIMPRLAYWKTALIRVSRVQYVKNSSGGVLGRKLVRQGVTARESDLRRLDAYYVHRLLQ
jgi:hypothetical protein